MLSDVTPPPNIGVPESAGGNTSVENPSTTFDNTGKEKRNIDPGIAVTATQSDLGQTDLSQADSVHGSSRDDRIVARDQIQVFPFGDLCSGLIDRWEAVRSNSGLIASGKAGGTPSGDILGTSRQTYPFFSPRFSAAVHAARGDVLVAVAFKSPVDAEIPPNPDDAIGFLPFHRVGGVGVPVGRFLNDAQNIVGLANEQIEWGNWLQACNVAAFDLHAIVDADPSWFSPYRLQKVKAFRADFMGDSLAFLRKLERDHRTIGKQGQKTRKLAREVGTLRLEIDCRCPKVLEKAIGWKRAQYQRTHILDLFLPDWTRRLIEVLHESQSDSQSKTSDENDLSSEQLALFADQPLRGILSVLWAGDQAVAAHIGMIEKGQLHYWFPTYDPNFSRYSPGTALFTEIVRASTSHKIDGIDMGYGEQPYKQKQTATTSEVAFGIITTSKWQRLVYSIRQQMMVCLKQVPMKDFFKRGWRAIFPTAGIQKLS